MGKIRLGILRGGPSNEYDVSLLSGASVIDELSRQPEKYDISDILISRDGSWNQNGLLSSPIRAMRRSDVFFNALHGFYGEDGKIQGFLDEHHFPYTGSTSFPSAFAMNKLLAKKYFLKAGLFTPHFVSFRNDLLTGASNEFIAKQRALLVAKSLPPPWVTKPVSGGSSLGMSITSDIDDLISKLHRSLLEKSEVFVEEVIIGREATCGIVENFHHQNHCALPPIEITVADKAGLFDYNAKYSGSTKETPYGSFSEHESLLLQQIARRAHGVLGLRHYSRTDMVLDSSGRVYVLEINALPGLTKNSLLPKSLEAAGSSLFEFLDHTIIQALIRG